MTHSYQVSCDGDDHSEELYQQSLEWALLQLAKIMLEDKLIKIKHETVKNKDTTIKRIIVELAKGIE